MGARRGGESKYGARTAEAYGYRFQSRAELAHAETLTTLVRGGALRSWCRPDPVVLVDAPKKSWRILLRVDFHVVTAAGAEEFHEVKGVRTEAWTIKERLWRAFGPPAPLRVFYRDREETIHSRALAAA